MRTSHAFSRDTMSYLNVSCCRLWSANTVTCRIKNKIEFVKKVLCHWTFCRLCVANLFSWVLANAAVCESGQHQSMNHTVDSTRSLNKICRQIAITGRCWRRCTQLARNHSDHGTREMNPSPHDDRYLQLQYLKSHLVNIHFIFVLFFNIFGIISLIMYSVIYC